MRLRTTVFLALMVVAWPWRGTLAEPMSAGPWAAATQPIPAEPSSIGSAAAGCLVGAVALPQDSAGVQILRPQRNRFWAHPRTVAFIRDLGRAAERRGVAPLLIGDMSQPRGGPMAYGHGSHQNGLDVDIWFRLPGKELSDAERSSPQPVSMVRGRKVDPHAWGTRQLKVLELAASSPEVDRIFVNPAIKAAVCRATRGKAAWVAKLRPWWGHDEHFHVRLSCTDGDVNCLPQPPVPAGDGCGAELSSWLAKSTVLPESSRDKPNTRRPDLPAACAAILTQPGPREALAR